MIALALESVLGIGLSVIADGSLSLSLIFVLGFLAQFVFEIQVGIASVTVGERATFTRLLLGIALGPVSILLRSAVDSLSGECQCTR